ncbi:hypothetical protein [Pseudoalteromonas denitrificans]|uniref:Uncharacterized protein n=1 Tax=Pseudoalteromonas denitrificans DSM 6059 TaxID=1123010 RepID=A0A1I1H042_9GAMM|nr:hypothetical protein [Pseudoalteromonas denitrificans]SFC15478.1 hypothetical protein SAMN02745724_01043 [Pseudoalteromonas denitrificans DSM 6059]
MNRKIALTALCLSAGLSSNIVIADVNDINTLNAKVTTVEANLLNAGVSVTGAELETIKINIINNEITDTGVTITEVVDKYELTDAEKRAVIIGDAGTNDDGGGVYPPK